MSDDYDENGDPVMTDADFERALDALREQDENGEVSELLSEETSTEPPS